MEPTASKVDCSIQFMHDDKPATATRRFSAVLHLFEHEYDDKCRFWYGVAEVDCVLSDVWKVWAAAPNDFAIFVECPDGRKGAARLAEGNLQSGYEGEYVRVAMVGITRLAVPRPLG